MPDQTTPNVGDALDAKQIDALPIGSVVQISIGTQYTKVEPDRDGDDWQQDNSRMVAWTASKLDHPPFRPVCLVYAPKQPDLFQQARVALRDRYGVEPTDADVDTVRLLMQERNLTPSAAVTALSVARSQPEVQPLAEIADTLLLVVVRGTDAATKLVVSADTTAGLARLRAHSALDSLLDQHGISR